MTQHNLVIPEILHQDMQNYPGSKLLPGMEKITHHPKQCHSEQSEESRERSKYCSFEISRVAQNDEQ